MDSWLRCIPPDNGGVRDDEAASADFKAPLEALRGDKTIQEIAVKHKVHPNQVSTWKRQAMDGLGAIFSMALTRSAWTTSRSSTISMPRFSSRWNGIFWPEGSSDEPGGPQGDNLDLSLSRQCLLSIARSSVYYAAKGESPANLALMRRIDELFLKYPFYGSRQMARQLRREGIHVVTEFAGSCG